MFLKLKKTMRRLAVDKEDLGAILIEMTNNDEITWERIESHDFFKSNRLLEKHLSMNQRKTTDYDLDKSFYTQIDGGLIFISTEKSVNEDISTINIQPHNKALVREYTEIENSDLLKLKNIIEEKIDRYNEFILKIIKKTQENNIVKIFEGFSVHMSESFKNRPYEIYNKAYYMNSSQKPKLIELKKAYKYCEFLIDNYSGTENSEKAIVLRKEILQKLKEFKKSE